MSIRALSRPALRSAALATVYSGCLALTSCTEVVKSHSGPPGTTTIIVAVPVARGKAPCTPQSKGSATLEDGYISPGPAPVPLHARSRATSPASGAGIAVSLVGASNQGIHTRIPSDSPNEQSLIIPTFSPGQQFLNPDITADNRLFVRAKEILLISTEIFDAALRNGNGDQYSTCPATIQVSLANTPDDTISIPGPQNLTGTMTPDQRKAIVISQENLYAQAEQIISQAQKNYVAALASPAK